MSLKRKRSVNMSFLWAIIPNEVIALIGKHLLCANTVYSRFHTTMRTLRNLLFVSKRFNLIFSHEMFWFICACKLPFSYEKYLSPFIQIIEYEDELDRNMIGFFRRPKFVISEKITEEDKKKIPALKNFLIKKYNLIISNYQFNYASKKLLK